MDLGMYDIRLRCDTREKCRIVNTCVKYLVIQCTCMRTCVCVCEREIAFHSQPCELCACVGARMDIRSHVGMHPRIAHCPEFFVVVVLVFVSGFTCLCCSPLSFTWAQL